MDEHLAEHLSENVLWSAIRRRQPLNEKYINHIRVCFDCHQLVNEVAVEAKTQGFNVHESFQTL